MEKLIQLVIWLTKRVLWFSFHGLIDCEMGGISIATGDFEFSAFLAQRKQEFK